jgi:hypothetical protein
MEPKFCLKMVNVVIWITCVLCFFGNLVSCLLELDKKFPLFDDLTQYFFFIHFMAHCGLVAANNQSLQKVNLECLKTHLRK